MEINPRIRYISQNQFMPKTGHFLKPFRPSDGNRGTTTGASPIRPVPSKPPQSCPEGRPLGSKPPDRLPLEYPIFGIYCTGSKSVKLSVN